ncbi:hypothetical protein HPB51_003228 [Rhipicephalus microplus]|uniref:Transposable element P transposase-like RNase H domain-containing protein n=1 Tax=Rhipicephalus microplus TaxID=6941 RepID=A0A9J6EEV8_RHIMP|nr:hypothetical protein HPB51_003228 [Rhipicephalus microplus]
MESAGPLGLMLVEQPLTVGNCMLVEVVVGVAPSCATLTKLTPRELGQPLPTERTLHCHLEDYKFTPGLLEDIMVPLALKVSLMSTEERHATLMLDEMQLAPGLVYNPSSGTVLGAPTIPLAD